MLFPVSGVEVNPLFPFMVAFCISFFTSMGGVSGAFLLLPFQISILGYSTPSVSATNQVFNIVAIPSGVYRYIREGRMLWPLALIVIIGTIPGVYIGAWARIEYLPDPKNFKLFASFVLLCVGWRLTIDAIRNKNKIKATKKLSGPADRYCIQVTISSFKRVEFKFNDQTYGFSPAPVSLLCFLVGIVGGIYGIGGGAIIAPFFVAIIGLPVYTVAGAALMGTFVTSVAGVSSYHLLTHFYPGMPVAPDWQLGGILGLGGALGMYLGARTQKFVPAGMIKGILSICVLTVAGKYILEFFL